MLILPNKLCNIGGVLSGGEAQTKRIPFRASKNPITRYKPKFSKKGTGGGLYRTLYISVEAPKNIT
jgi:hypothetical protein